MQWYNFRGFIQGPLHQREAHIVKACSHPSLPLTEKERRQEGRGQVGLTSGSVNEVTISSISLVQTVRS